MVDVLFEFCHGREQDEPLDVDPGPIGVVLQARLHAGERARQPGGETCMRGCRCKGQQLEFRFLDLVVKTRRPGAGGEAGGDRRADTPSFEVLDPCLAGPYPLTSTLPQLGIHPNPRA